MSANNSIARGVRDAAPTDAPRAFEIPSELAARYEIRTVEAADADDRRVGLFLAADRQTPAIEIANDRIVARREDAETVASLVTIARHNGWDRIDVDGSPEFRKAVWTAASREGLIVSGYEPSFAEQEAISALRRPTEASQIPETAQPSRSASGEPGATGDREPSSVVSDADRRLLLTLSRHSEDWRALQAGDVQTPDAFERDVRAERIEQNGEALETALTRALDSPTLARAFAAAGVAPEALRATDRDAAWQAELAEAIQRVRAGADRSDIAPAPGTAPSATALDALDTELEDRAVAASTVAAPRSPPVSQAPEEHARAEAVEREEESRTLAELFLNGGEEALAAEPRLANALQAQTAMEQHIGEVFDGDVAGSAAATLESRQMISDVLRRGLDVSVREPSPVRQIEPLVSHPDPER